MTGLRLHKLLPVLHFIRHLGKRVYRDDITVLAGHLAYVSLLSLVPLVTVIFALFAAFPVFSDVSVELRHFIFTNFMPATGDVIQRYLEQFILNSSRMTAVGTCGLIVTALLLIYSVDTVLNSIWRSKNKRPIIFSFAVYWMVLTLGPLLAGASMVLSSYLFSLTWLNVSGANGLLTLLLRIFPLLLSCASFWLLYSLVPTVRVPARDALVAGALFELGKKGFGLYVTLFPSYQLIYGVLAVIPILFLWVYWSWCIVLLGAEITASLSEHRLAAAHHAAQTVRDTDDSVDTTGQAGQRHHRQ